MKSLHLGVVDDFPFIEAPSKRAITDGYQLLAELGAVTDANELTRTGSELAKLPLDPRVGRMILEARDRQALDEVLVIASALSVQDVRDRPLEAQSQADQAHVKFDDEKSEFTGYLLRQNFVNIRRVREWRDTHTQLHTTVAEHRWQLNAKPASYEQIHMSMMAGLLGNVGCKQDDEDVYLGARGIKFYRHPGAHLSKKPGRWTVVSELVETTRLFGRGIANIEPAWLEQVGAHLLRKQLLDPHWEKKSGEVIALERATLYGLVVYSGRRVPFGKVDPQTAREIFIREALVQGQWETNLTFLDANHKMIAKVEELEHKSRRQDVLVDDVLFL
jgi:ATP-dependent helicase HrpA